AGRGAEVLVQRLAGSRQAAPEGALEVIDPLPVLLARRWDDLALLPADTVVTWPLITGLTDDRDQWRLGCDALASAGVACVVAVVLEVAPRNRRRLLEQIEADDDGAFDRLFHGRAADPRAFARTAAAANLEPFWRRRTTSRERSASNRQLAEVLALGAEIWLRLGRSESRGQELYASARRVDEASVHVAALAREGNASILPWLSVAALELVEEWSRTGASATLDAWLAEYTRGGGEEVPGV
ncbi:MAG: hypothetical protein R3190_08165, partial [Thermoanaerobaculia bacterium]|nr:hypothetical protein [Thermoanaerobaculia bacterium]